MALDHHKKGSAFDSAARWVGDLDHPFYDDERQRHVWYEASAVGFQLTLLLQLVVVGIVMLVMGQDALPIVAFALAPVGLAALVAVSYAHRRGAQYSPSRSDMGRSRGLAAAAIVVLYGAGALRMSLDGAGTDTAGFLVGVVSALVVMVVAIWIQNRRSKASATIDDLD